MINFVVGYDAKDETFSFIDYTKMDMAKHFLDYINGKEMVSDTEVLRKRIIDDKVQELCYIYYIPKDGAYKEEFKLETIDKEIFRNIHEDYNQNHKDSVVNRDNPNETVVYLRYKRKRYR